MQNENIIYPVLVRMSLVTGENPKKKLLFYILNLSLLLIGYLLVDFYYISVVLFFGGLYYSLLDSYTVIWILAKGDWKIYSFQEKPRLMQQLYYGSFISIVAVLIMMTISWCMQLTMI